MFNNKGDWILSTYANIGETWDNLRTKAVLARRRRRLGPDQLSCVLFAQGTGSTSASWRPSCGLTSCASTSGGHLGEFSVPTAQMLLQTA